MSAIAGGVFNGMTKSRHGREFATHMSEKNSSMPPKKSGTARRFALSSFHRLYLPGNRN
jgi:hypothetical protein